MRPDRDELLVHADRILALIDNGETDLADGVLQVPVERYSSQRWYDLEVDRLFGQQPMPVAFSAEVHEPGDFVSISVLGTPLLVVRGQDGVARTFINTCRHRGSRVVPEGCGTATRFACPYHAWSYDAAGTLVRIPGERLFGEVDRSTHGLTSLQSEERHGVVFTALRPGESLHLDTWLGDFDAELERLDLDSRNVAWTNTLPGPNWKLCADGYTENYHFPFLHPDTISVNNLPNVMAHDSWDQFQRIFMPRRSITELRKTAEAETAAQIASHWATVHYLFPNTMLSSSWGDWTFVSQIWPGDGPDSSMTRQIMLTTQPLDSPEVKAMAAHQREAFYAIINGDDYTVGRGIQAGIAGRGNTHFSFGRNEIGAQHFHRWIEKLTAEKGAIS